MRAQLLHKPALLREVIDALEVERGVFVDATVGTGGHALAILHRLKEGLLVGLDRDPEMLRIAEPVLRTTGKAFLLVQANFRDLKRVLEERNIPRVDGLLADLGVSLPQLLSAERGFSFRGDAPLDMRMNPEEGKPASWYLYHLPVSELERVFRELGEIPWARRLAETIERMRMEGFSFQRAQHLVEAVRRAMPKRWRKKIHPATQAFMAIRILVNEELEALDALLAQLPEVLRPGARVVILSYHSLEDRRVKRAFKEWARKGRAVLRKPFPLMADWETRQALPQSRSVRLRALRWLG